MQCKSLWIKASAKCINVNVNIISEALRLQLKILSSGNQFLFEKCQQQESDEN